MPKPVKERLTQEKVEKRVSEQAVHNALLIVKKLEKEVPDFKPAEIQVQKVQEAKVSKPDLQAERKSSVEINNLVAWGRQPAESRQNSSAQTELVKAIQPRAVTECPDVVGRTFDLLDVMPHINPKSVSMEAEQEHVEGTAIDGLEAHAQLNDFDIKELDFKPSEESLLIDDTYLETGIIEENEEGVDVLLADLEEGMQQVEAEYMGELLVRTLADFFETDQVEDVQTFQALVPEVETGIINEGFEKEFSLYLKSLEPEQVEATTNVIEELGVVLKESQQPSEKTTSEEKYIVEHRLEELCILLFEGLGLEYDEEIIKQFIQSIIAQELLSNTNVDSDEQLPIDELNYLGTREHKTLASAPLQGGLAQFIKQKMQSHLVLGRYALQAL